MTSRRRVVSRKTWRKWRARLRLSRLSASTLSPSQPSAPVIVTTHSLAPTAGSVLARFLAHRGEATAPQMQATRAHAPVRPSHSTACRCRPKGAGRKRALRTGHARNVNATSNRVPWAGHRQRALLHAVLHLPTVDLAQVRQTFVATPLTCWRIGHPLAVPSGLARPRANPRLHEIRNCSVP